MGATDVPASCNSWEIRKRDTESYDTSLLVTQYACSLKKDLRDDWWDPQTAGVGSCLELRTKYCPTPEMKRLIS